MPRNDDEDDDHETDNEDGDDDDDDDEEDDEEDEEDDEEDEEDDELWSIRVRLLSAVDLPPSLSPSVPLCPWFALGLVEDVDAALDEVAERDNGGGVGGGGGGTAKTKAPASSGGNRRRRPEGTGAGVATTPHLASYPPSPPAARALHRPRSCPTAPGGVGTAQSGKRSTAGT